MMASENAIVTFNYLRCDRCEPRCHSSFEDTEKEFQGGTSSEILGGCETAEYLVTFQADVIVHSHNACEGQSAFVNAFQRI